MTGRPTHTDQGRSTAHPAENPVATAAGVGFALGNVVTGLVLWLDSYLPHSAPAVLDQGLKGLAIAAGAATAIAIGRFGQRWTTRLYFTTPPE